MQCLQGLIGEEHHPQAYLQLAIRGDEEFNTLIKDTIAGGGFITHIHKFRVGCSAGPLGWAGVGQVVVKFLEQDGGVIVISASNS